MNYYVTYEVMDGSIGLIIVKHTNIWVESGDTWTQITRAVRKVDPGAKVIGYSANDDEGYDDMMVNVEFF